MKCSALAITLWAGVGLASAHVLILPQDLHSSDGCGPNPLSIVFTVASDLGHLAASEVMAVLESDPETWGEFLNLIHAYDDCIRAGQLRYKRRASSAARGSDSTHVLSTLKSALTIPRKYSNSSLKSSSKVNNMPTRSQFLLQRFLRQEEEAFYPHKDLSH